MLNKKFSTIKKVCTTNVSDDKAREIDQKAKNYASHYCHHLLISTVENYTDIVKGTTIYGMI